MFQLIGTYIITTIHHTTALKIMYYLNVGATVIAVLLSIYAVVATRGFRKMQIEFGAIQAKLNKLLSQQAVDDKDNSTKARLLVTVEKIGSSNHKVHIFNEGNASAKNVRFEYDKEDRIFIESDISRKFPYELLNTGQTIKLIACFTMGGKHTTKIKLMWDDEYKKDNEQKDIVTL